MKKNLLKISACLVMITMLFVACKDDDDDKKVDGSASFTMEQTTDAWNYKFTNTSSASGTATWELGNGQVATGNSVEAYYPVQGEYEVKLTVSASSGVLTSTETVTIEETDSKFFDHPFFQALTGGLDNASGKTWMMDKKLGGHYALGPGGGDWSSYHSAAGMSRDGFGYYDDELTFILDGFVAKYYVGEDAKFVCRQEEMSKKSDYYANGVDPEGTAGFEYAVDFALASDAGSRLTQAYAVTITPGAGEGVGDDSTEDLIAIQFIGDAPMNAFFDPGTVGNTWYVDTFDENYMTLYCQAAGDYDIEDGPTYYQIKMAAEGYLTEPATFDVSSDIKANGVVDFVITHTGGAEISNVNWDFGDGTDDNGLTVSNTYSTNLTYNAIATITDDIGVITTTNFIITIDDMTDATDAVVDWAMFEDDTDKIEFSKMGGDSSGDGIIDLDGGKVLQATKVEAWSNTTADLGGEIDISTNTIVKFKAKGKAGYRLAVNLYNDSEFPGVGYGPDAHPLQYYYIIQADDVWEDVIFDFSFHTGYDASRTTGWYDNITIFLNPEPVPEGEVVYFDDFEGPALP